MQSRKRRRAGAPSMHPHNRYSEKPPDFDLLASLYPSFQPFVFSSRSGRPTIDWTDFNATRELTRVLLLHDHGVHWHCIEQVMFKFWYLSTIYYDPFTNCPQFVIFLAIFIRNCRATHLCREKSFCLSWFCWIIMDEGIGVNSLICIRWIPDGQLCPTVPNRSNYIHWIEDLLSSELVPASNGSRGSVRGFDIGTGANCIYPLLGASLLGWSFVGSDVTDVALEWARKNVEFNPHLSRLIEIRDANSPSCSNNVMPNSEEEELAEFLVDVVKVPPLCPETKQDLCREVTEFRVDVEKVQSLCPETKQDLCREPPVLVGVIRDGENFDFCMCNPPFFESISEAGLNRKTSCGGTLEEMVYPGGERAFITRIIEDSVMLKQSFRWFTSMVGRKTNLKFLVSKLHELGASVVKTTEFVQGQTARWGLAWSFMSPSKKIISLNTPRKNHHSFMLEGLQRQFGAFQVLKSVESFFLAIGASCKSDLPSFFVNITLSSEQTDRILNGKPDDFDGDGRVACSTSSSSDNLQTPSEALSFRVSVFEQIPGTLLVRGSLLLKESPLSGIFSSLLGQLEEALKKEFLAKPYGTCRS